MCYNYNDQLVDWHWLRICKHPTLDKSPHTSGVCDLQGHMVIQRNYLMKIQTSDMQKAGNSYRMSNLDPQKLSILSVTIHPNDLLKAMHPQVSNILHPTRPRRG